MFRYKINVMEELKKAGYSSTRLRNENILGESTMNLLRHNKMVRLENLDKICSLLNLPIDGVIEHIK